MKKIIITLSILSFNIAVATPLDGKNFICLQKTEGIQKCQTFSVKNEKIDHTKKPIMYKHLNDNGVWEFSDKKPKKK